MKPLLQTVNESYQYNTEKSSEVDTKLTVTKEMLRQARGNKMHMIVLMRPQDFIRLTTSENPTQEMLVKQCRSIDDYNQWADEGETIIMPALWVRKGTVVGHEGRHRAAALICDGEWEMPVSVRLYPEKEHQEEYGYWDAEYQMRFNDLPEALHGQYGKGIVLKSDINVVIDGWNNIK